MKAFQKEYTHIFEKYVFVYFFCRGDLYYPNGNGEIRSLVYICTFGYIINLTKEQNDFSVYLAIAVSAMCFFMNGFLPLIYEMSCELAYPIHEGIVGVSITIAINVAAVVFLLLGLVPNIGVFKNIVY